MRQISSFVSAALIVAIVAGWTAVTVTRANTGKTDDFPARYSIGGPSLPVVY
jgi:hypothetical protein